MEADRVFRLSLLPQQAEFFQLECKHSLFVGGFGSGKTETLLASALRDGIEAPSALIALYEPTYDLVRLILAPRLEERLTEHGIRYAYNKTENIIRCFDGVCATFVLRTLDNPGRIIGYESYRAHVDEIDTLPEKQAVEAWRKIIARNRQKPKGVEAPFNRVSAYSTPEGFRFAYKHWVKDKKPGYELVRASTRSNPFLPDDYIATLEASYPPQLIKAYLDGQFVNLTSGAVYPDFDRKLNHAATVAAEGEPVHVGMDFNVNKMAAVIFVVRDEAPHAISELTNVRDTPEMARMLCERWKAKGHHVTVYPDASGQNTSSKSASESDLSILKQAGLSVRAQTSNPRVKDRVNSLNALILNGAGVRRLKVNTDQAPDFTESLEQQTYNEQGEPDKKSGLDHTNDGAGYFCVNRWPIVKLTTRVTPLIV